MTGRTYAGDHLSRVLSCSLSDDTDVDNGGETEHAREFVWRSANRLGRDRPDGDSISGLVSGPPSPNHAYTNPVNPVCSLNWVWYLKMKVV